MDPFVSVLKVGEVHDNPVLCIGLDFSDLPHLRDAFIEKFKAVIADNTTGLEPLRIGVSEDPKRHDIAIWFDEPEEDNGGMIDAILVALAERVMQFRLAFESYVIGEDGTVDTKSATAQRHAGVLELVPVRFV